MSVVAFNRLSSQAAEGALRTAFGGKAASFETSVGTRFVDNLTADGIAQEAKVGLVGHGEVS